MRKLFLLLLTMISVTLCAQQLPSDGPLTLRPRLQELGTQLLKGKTGSIVAINPANGEILCLATNTPQGPDVRQAIGKPNAPGSTFKTAQALTLLSTTTLCMSRAMRPSPPGAAICSRWGWEVLCISISRESRADCWQVPTI